MSEYLDGSPGRQTQPDPVAPNGPNAGRGGAANLQRTVEFRGRTLSFAPGSQAHALLDPQYEAAFANYLAGGPMVNVPQAALQTTEDSRGGYVAPMRFTTELIQALDDAVFMRGLARVLPPLVQGTSIGVPSLDTDPNDAEWTQEVRPAAPTPDDAMRLGGREMFPHLLAKSVEVSAKLLRAGAIDVEALVRERLAYKYGISEEKAFLTGDGVKKPLGVFTASDSGIPTSRDVTTTATAFDDDDLVSMAFSLKGDYFDKSTWLVSREFVKRLRKLKAGDGRPIWNFDMGAEAKLQPTILTRPYVMSENVPATFTSGAYVAVLGDFSHYWIIDSLMMNVIVFADSTYRTRGLVLFYGEKETDGQPVLAEAFSRMKLA
jgi:HK97 family phage major capsid protein